MNTRECYYVVQIHSMHSGIHSIIAFENEEDATQLFDFVNECGQFPEGEVTGVVHEQEINFRNPPEFLGWIDDEDRVELIYVNNPVNTIPQVYG